MPATPLPCLILVQDCVVCSNYGPTLSTTERFLRDHRAIPEVFVWHCGATVGHPPSLGQITGFRAQKQMDEELWRSMKCTNQTVPQRRKLIDECHHCLLSLSQMAPTVRRGATCRVHWGACRTYYAAPPQLHFCWSALGIGAKGQKFPRVRISTL